MYGKFMATKNQEMGHFGEDIVSRSCSCPKCKKQRTLRRLPPNFKCADVICDFCGYLAQVKATAVKDINLLPDTVLGAAWGPQKERMDAGLYFPLFLVLVDKSDAKKSGIYYLSADLQPQKMFLPRKALSMAAKRAGWQGFLYDLKPIKDRFVRLT
jgi:hypothetical protein